MTPTQQQQHIENLERQLKFQEQSRNMRITLREDNELHAVIDENIAALTAAIDGLKAWAVVEKIPNPK